jgi:hypothetical protein
MAKVKKGEMKNVVHSFQKDKSLGPDGYPIEIYLGFYEMLEDYVLVVVEEYSKLEKILGALNLTCLDLIPKKYASNAFEDFRTSLQNHFQCHRNKAQKRYFPRLNLQGEI